MEDPSAPHARARSNVAYACESCRAAKVKCQSESPSGICKRCSEFRRQCVYRTGPRTRRPKLSSRPAAEIPPPPPPPGKTFSFDFSMPAAEEPDGDFEELRMKHEGYFKELVPDADPADEAAPTSLSSSAVFDFSDLSSGATPSTSCPSVSSRPEQQPIANLGIKPQFNLDSAADLLASFRHMLPSFPCLVLPPDTNVRTMAREAPFVLLAILAVTSCSVSLQSHSLYDEEFRKVLGLKFVAGGERSLELLQGLLVYCSWYPLHVRPKNKQVPQYMRMAVDLVHDLELDQEHDLANPHVQPPADALPRLRALLASFYCASSFAWGWGKPPLLRHTSWVAACGDALEARSPLAQDHALVWLARFQSVLEESNQLKRRAGDKTTTSTSSSHGLLRLGLDAQLRAFQARVPEALWAAYPSLQAISRMATFQQLAGPWRCDRGAAAPPPPPSADPDPAIAALRAYLDAALALAPGGLAGADAGRLVVGCVRAFRLSFPSCSSADPAWAARRREALGFGAWLAAMTCSTSPAASPSPDVVVEKGVAGGGGTDLLAALRVVLRSLRARYERTVAAAAAGGGQGGGRGGGRAALGCPVLDGSLDQYLARWSGQAAAASAEGLPAGGAKSSPQVVFHDLWATMTMGWTADGDGDNDDDEVLVVRPEEPQGPYAYAGWGEM